MKSTDTRVALPARSAIQYTYDHLEAAACAWEYVLGQIAQRERNNWHRFAESWGMAQLRAQVIEHAPAIQGAYELAVARKEEIATAGCFDWDFVPAYLAEHCDEILGYAETGADHDNSDRQAG